MPGLNGTGPFGQGQMTGRGFGRCRFIQARPEPAMSPIEAPESAEHAAAQSGEMQNKTGAQAPFYGAGHGGIPYGCGRGRVFAGGRRRCGW